jgi:hypothetical protein
MDQVEIERRFSDAMRQAGLSKEAEADEMTAAPLQDEEVTEQIETVGEAVEKVEGDRRPPPAPTLINIFEHPEAHPYVLDLALLKKYGPEWFEWEPETLELQIPQDFKTPRISDLNMEKPQAVKTLHYVDDYWKAWQVFVACTMPLNNAFPDFEVMQIPTAVQCAVSVAIADRIRNDVPWSDEMKLYVGVACKFDGIFCPIEPITFAEVDSEDYPVDCEDIKKRWPFVRRTGKVPDEETVEAEQLRRMLLIHEAVREDGDRLRNQLPLLLHG